MSFFSRLQSNKGSALLASMVAALSVGIVSAIILQQSQVTEKQTRLPRIKSAMVSVEAQLHEALNTGVFLEACAPGSAAGCMKINQAKLNKMAVVIPGAKCAAGVTTCGIEVRNSNYDNPTQTFTAQIVYTGEEIAVAPVNLNMQVQQTEAWLNQNSNCGPSAPLLVGFNNDGSKICKALPSTCPAGSYVASVDPMSLTSGGVLCTQFPTNVSCPPGQIVSGFRWIGGPSSFNVACAPLVNPFSPTALNDPTSYSYASAGTPAVSSWPTTTVASPTTTMPSATTTTMGGMCHPRILFPYSGGPGMNCTASPLPDDCTSMGACSTDGQVLIHPYLGCANVACVCRCLGPATTTTTTTTTTTMPSAWYKCKMDGFGDYHRTGGPYATQAICTANTGGCSSGTCACIPSAICQWP